MLIDNSRANAFRKCPDFYKERYVNKLERNWGNSANSPFGFGKRIHELLEEHFKALGGLAYEPYPPAEEPTESECQAMFAAYCAHYPVEPFVPVAVEQVFQVAIPGTAHIYTGKFDAIVRYLEAPYTNQLAILEHKSEKRSGVSNLPEAWAARSQVSLYMWAAEQLYNERPAHIVLDVLRRQSEKGQEPCSFYRDTLERTAQQSETAIADLVYVADQISELTDTGGHWPQNTDQCMVGRWACDYYSKHIIGDTPEMVQISYRPAEEYLSTL